MRPLPNSPAPADHRCILRRGRRDAPIRLFCFAYAGGNAAAFLPWHEKLEADIELCAIQLPGRGARFAEAPHADMRGIVTDIVEALIPLLDRPFIFFGHSLGALLAYEVAHALMARALRLPDHLVVSGAHSPRLRKVEKALHLLDDVALTAELAKYAGTPEEILANRELMALILPIVRADFKMAVEYAYVPRPRIPLPVTVFAGQDDEFDDPAQYEDWLTDSSKPGKVHWFDGGHFFINSANGQVLRELRRIIGQSRDAAVPALI